MFKTTATPNKKEANGFDGVTLINPSVTPPFSVNGLEHAKFRTQAISTTEAVSMVTIAQGGKFSRLKEAIFAKLASSPGTNSFATYPEDLKGAPLKDINKDETKAACIYLNSLMKRTNMRYRVVWVDYQHAFVTLPDTAAPQLRKRRTSIESD